MQMLPAKLGDNTIAQLCNAETGEAIITIRWNDARTEMLGFIGKTFVAKVTDFCPEDHFECMMIAVADFMAQLQAAAGMDMPKQGRKGLVN